jgi:hypothetical protein
MLPRLTVIVAFRETGWRRPLVDPVALEVWGPDGHLVATLPASHLLELVRWHLAGLTLQGRLGAYLEPPPPRLPAATGRRLRRPAPGA